MQDPSQKGKSKQSPANKYVDENFKLTFSKLKFEEAQLPLAVVLAQSVEYTTLYAGIEVDVTAKAVDAAVTKAFGHIGRLLEGARGGGGQITLDSAQAALDAIRQPGDVNADVRRAFASVIFWYGEGVKLRPAREHVMRQLNSPQDPAFGGPVVQGTGAGGALPDGGWVKFLQPWTTYGSQLQGKGGETKATYPSADPGGAGQERRYAREDVFNTKPDGSGYYREYDLLVTTTKK